MSESNITTFNGRPLPSGEKLLYARSRPICPERPIVPYIEGDGAGPGIWRATRRVMDSAVSKAYGGSRAIAWYEVFAGQKSKEEFGEWLPEDTISAIRHCGIGLVGALLEPVATGVRNRIQKTMLLPHRLRPVTSIPAWPSPARLAGVVKMMILSDALGTAGATVDLEPASPDAQALASLLARAGQKVPPGSAFHVAAVSPDSASSLLRRAVSLAGAWQVQALEVVHGGEQGRSTLGWFKEWCFMAAEEQFRANVIPQKRLDAEFSGVLPPGCISIRQVSFSDLLAGLGEKPDNTCVVVCPATLAEPLTQALNSQLGMLRLSPLALLGDACSVFASAAARESAPPDQANPCSLLLAGITMLEYLSWREAAELVFYGVSKAIEKRLVTYDLEPFIKGATKIKTSDFATVIIDNIVKR